VSRRALRAALELLLENTPRPPERNCACHLSPPCHDCVEWGGLREALADADAAMQGEAQEEADDRALLRDALDHIARVAEQARRPTNRLAFVVHRARCALAGRPYVRAEVKVPPSGASETERAQRRAQELAEMLRELAEADAAVAEAWAGFSQVDAGDAGAPLRAVKRLADAQRRQRVALAAALERTAKPAPVDQAVPA
jgi:hypothetical protein